MSQVIELKTVTEMGIDFVEPEPDYFSEFICQN